MKVKVSELQNWNKNPREISDKKLSQLITYIDKYPSLVRLIVDPRDKKTVLGGNQRLKAIKELKWDELEIVYAEGVVDDATALEVALIDNNQFGSYVELKLSELALEFKDELNLEDFDIDFTPMNLDVLVNTEEINYSNKNKEVDIGSLGNTAILAFKFDYNVYHSVLELLANAQEKTESDTNEDTLLKLLQPYA